MHTNQPQFSQEPFPLHKMGAVQKTPAGAQNRGADPGHFFPGLMIHSRNARQVMLTVLLSTECSMTHPCWAAMGTTGKCHEEFLCCFRIQKTKGPNPRSYNAFPLAKEMQVYESVCLREISGDGQMQPPSSIRTWIGMLSPWTQNTPTNATLLRQRQS